MYVPGSMSSRCVEISSLKRPHLRNKNQQRRVQMLDLFIYFIDVFATGDAVNDIETNFRWISYSLNSTCEIVVVVDLLCVMLSKYWSSTLARCSPVDFG